MIWDYLILNIEALFLVTLVTVGRSTYKWLDRNTNVFEWALRLFFWLLIAITFPISLVGGTFALLLFAPAIMLEGASKWIYTKYCGDPK